MRRTCTAPVVTALAPSREATFLGLSAGLLATLALALFAAPSWAQVPDKRIPPSVMLEVRVVEAQFNAALANDCSPERCYTKGCVYEDHMTLDQARSSSLPGLPAEEGPGGAGPPQEYLTRVKCAFAYEKDIASADVRKLAQRLRRRLSHGWLTVSVTPSSLEPIPKSLLEDPPKEEAKDEEVVEEEPVKEPEEPQELTGTMAIKQLWESLLPHFPWMLAIFFLTLAILMLIWAARRLGAKSLEDTLLEAQMMNGPPPGSEEPKTVEVAEPEPPPSKADEEFADAQEEVWNARLDRMSDADEDIIKRLLREWLRQGEYPTLARALFVFGDRVAQAFDDAPELALRKVEFAEYFRDVDQNNLPSRAKFFRQLNQQAMSSLLLSQDDVQLYRSLRDDFGASGVVGLTKELPPRYGALLFALVGDDLQREVAGLYSPEVRTKVAEQLLASTRISLTESAYLAECVEAVREGRDPPKAPPNTSSREHGPPIDSAGALSRLLTYVGGDDRAALFNAVLQRHDGSLPHWYEDIVFNHMLTALPEEVRNDLILEVDIRGLAAWLQMQPQAWRKAFVAELNDSLQTALFQNNNARSRSEQLHWARKGHESLVKAFKGAYAQRGLRFVDVVA